MFRAGWGAALLAAALLLGIRERSGLRITVLDVGQGDCILAEAGEFACLIDAGSSSVSSVWKYRIESALKARGISKLDAVFLSHGDSDHINGIQELFEDYETNCLGTNIGGITLKRLLLPDTAQPDETLEELRQEAEKLQIPAGYLSAGGSVDFKELHIECLYPLPKLCTGDANEDSMVLLLRRGSFSALFTGDLEEEGERRFLRYYLEEGERRFLRYYLEEGQTAQNVSDITVLKVGHHGSKYGTSETFLETLRPQTAVISCGKDNRYGHPAQEVLERLEDCGAKVLRTDQDGAVEICVK